VISFTTAELEALITSALWPAIRILALFATAPIFSERSIPRPAKVGLAFAIAFVLAPVLPAPPAVSLGSGAAFSILIQQVAIGATLGFAVRLALAAIEMAGEVIGLQMGLSFAGFFDLSNPQGANAAGSLLGLAATLLFLAIDGHLLVIGALAESFNAFPVGEFPKQLFATNEFARMGGQVFSTALSLALPMITVMLFTNLALGVVARAAPQLNIFSFGFPVSLIFGLCALYLTLPYLSEPLQRTIGASFAIFMR
jgi:flagellar biosynthetic protein FliR